MGQPQTYIRGGGSHKTVPPPIHDKIQLYRSTKKLSIESNVTAHYTHDVVLNNNNDNANGI